MPSSLADPLDEYAVQELKESDGEDLKFLTKEGLEMEDVDIKQELGALKAETHQKFGKKVVLGDKG